MRYHKIPDETVRRLAIYLRGLNLLSQQGKRTISSSELARLMHVKSAQIRKDFSYFGAFGTPGVGYSIRTLIKRVSEILRINTVNPVVLVGAGNLGSALLAYPGFEMYNLKIVAVFDSSPAKIGQKMGDIVVEDISHIADLRKRNIRIAIVAVPEDAAQDIADKLVEADVTGILNFAPCRLVVPPKVKVISVDIAMDLARLPYYI